MAQLAIRGHATRGKEVIEIFEMLGVNNKHQVTAMREKYVYFVDRNTIIFLRINQILPEQFIIFTLEEFLEKFPYKVGDKVQHKGATSCGSVFEVEKMRWEGTHVEYTIKRLWYNNCYATVTAEDLQPYKEETMEDKGTLVQIDLTRELCVADEVEVILGDYEFVLKDGKTYFVKKKLQYPKTYDECCEVLSLGEDGKLYTKGYKASLIQDFQKLLICRDTYWQIAGKQMKFGKSWKPYWEDTSQSKYSIWFNNNGICIKSNTISYSVQHILTFPTAEMRDAFYDNFKELIEQYK